MTEVRDPQWGRDGAVARNARGLLKAEGIEAGEEGVAVKVGKDAFNFTWGVVTSCVWLPGVIWSSETNKKTKPIERLQSIQPGKAFLAPLLYFSFFLNSSLNRPNRSLLNPANFVILPKWRLICLRLVYFWPLQQTNYIFTITNMGPDLCCL